MKSFLKRWLGYDAACEAARKEGFNLGLVEGMTNSSESARRSGYEKGLAEGCKLGEADRRKAATDRFNAGYQAGFRNGVLGIQPPHQTDNS